MRIRIIGLSLLTIISSVQLYLTPLNAAVAGETAENAAAPQQVENLELPSGELEKIISGEEKIPPVRGEVLVERLDQRLHRIGDWFSRESGELFSVAFITTILIIIAAVVNWFFGRLRRKIINPGSRLAIRLFFALTGPLLALLITVIVFALLLPVMQTTPFYTASVRIFFTVVTLLLTATAMRMISAFSDRMLRYARRDDNNLDALMVDITRKIVKIVVAAVALLFIGQTIFNLNITTLLAGAGVVGLAVAFASRETLADFFGTLVIILDAPFRCGDRIEVTGVDGIVEEVGIRSTRIRTRNETLVVIPNRQIAEANVENISRRGTFRFMFTIGMVYQTSPENMELAMKILHEIVDDFHGPDAAGFTPRIFFDSFGSSGINITVIMWLKTEAFIEEERMRTEINSEILRRFNAAGLEFAYNTVTNILAGDPDHPLTIAATPKKEH